MNMSTLSLNEYLGTFCELEYITLNQIKRYISAESSSILFCPAVALAARAHMYSTIASLQVCGSVCQIHGPK